MKIKDLVLGKPLKNDQIKHEKLSRMWGLPIMASDAVSSVAYAIEEILIVLLPALAMAAFGTVPKVVIPILLLMVILVISYSKIIDHYPNGGGAYAVAKANLGRTTALIAASALIIDYILTVAVSISSSTAALTSAFPQLMSYKVYISLLCIAIITLINLRGIKEASKVFGLPTYIFIFCMFALVVVGFIKIVMGNLNPIVYHKEDMPRIEEAFTLFVLLKAFSSGCAAMSGIEAVSNAVPSFKSPSSKNAKHILYMLAGIILFIFGGTSLLAIQLKVVTVEGHTVLSQIAGAVFGNGPMFYLIQIFTSLILILAANTAYNGLPQLLYLLGHDGFVPRQFSSRGTKLSFSNGIIFIWIMSSALVIGFKSDTHSLIPLYSVGVFISFTVAQYGMFKQWRVTKEKNWQYKCWINGFGAIVTLVVSCIVFGTKFHGGAWILGIIMPTLMLLMSMVNRHYTKIGKELELTEFKPHYRKNQEMEDLGISTTQCILLVQNINKPFLKSLNYANTISSNIVAVHICGHPEHAEQLKADWARLEIPIQLIIIEKPYRDIIRPLDNYLWEREKKLKSGENISVVLSKLVMKHWYDLLLHNQMTYFLERVLGKHKNIATVTVPFHYELDMEKYSNKK